IAGGSISTGHPYYRGSAWVARGDKRTLIGPEGTVVDCEWTRSNVRWWCVFIRSGYDESRFESLVALKAVRAPYPLWVTGPRLDSRLSLADRAELVHGVLAEPPPTPLHIVFLQSLHAAGPRNHDAPASDRPRNQHLGRRESLPLGNLPHHGVIDQ